MEKTVDYLLEWAENYFKSKDAITKRVVAMEKKGNALVIKYKHKQATIIIKPNLDDFASDIEKFGEDDHFSIIALNSESNIKLFLENWKKIEKYKFLSFYFVNPFSDTEKKWIIYPHTHNKITEEKTLKLGINSLAEAVQKISFEEYESKLIS